MEKKMKKVVASGYFNPLHKGHVEYLKRAKELGDYLIVIINNDKQVKKKKAILFQDEEERKIIVSSNQYVDEAIISIDEDLTINKTLEKIRPDIFAKGGDAYGRREKELCKRLGIEIVSDLGKKIQSSSELIKKARHYDDKRKLILVCGIPGSGKTTLAKKIVENMNAFFIDKDDVQDSLTTNRSGEYYESIRLSTYEIMYVTAASNIKLGKNVVMTAPLVKEMQSDGWRGWFKRYIKSINADLRLIWCFADEKTIKKRLKKRGYHRDFEKLMNWEEFLEREPICIDISFNHIKIDTSKEYDIFDIIKFIEEN